MQRPWGRKEETEQREEGRVIGKAVRECVCVCLRERRQRQTDFDFYFGWMGVSPNPRRNVVFGFNKITFVAEWGTD